MQDFVLTDFNIDFRNDASLRRLQGGWTLHALFAKNKVALQPTKVTSLLTHCLQGCSQYQFAYGLFRQKLALQERINFSPHPKTLTMAGDYEYFAAQVKVPWLVDLGKPHFTPFLA